MLLLIHKSSKRGVFLFWSGKAATVVRLAPLLGEMACERGFEGEWNGMDGWMDEWMDELWKRVALPRCQVVVVEGGVWGKKRAKKVRGDCIEVSRVE